MARLSGSPLGLIGLESSATRDGMSTFTGGKSRNVNVNDYNVGKTNKGYGNKSIFYGERYFRPFPAMGNDPKGESKDNNTKNYRISRLHSDSLYDTSVLNIIEKLAGTRAELRAQDFAYLKDIGVYPNNRLMIARRFPGGIGNNLFRKVDSSHPPSLATLISWQTPAAESFFKISFGEVWTDAEADFTEILNSLGDDFGKSIKNNVMGKVGGAVAAGLNAMPFPGITEQLQRKVLEKLGIYEPGASDLDLPSGDPNLIKEAKRRQVGGASGLNCSFSVAMTCEWEQKFISGIDPTVVWLDIMSLVLRFGTSNSRFFGLGERAGNKISDYANNIEKLIQDVVEAIKSVVSDITQAITGSLQAIGESFKSDPGPVQTDDKGQQLSKEDLRKKYEEDFLSAGEDGEKRQKATEDYANGLAALNNQEAKKKKKDEENQEATKSLAGVKQLFTSAIELAKDALVKLVRKYKVKIVGVINALSGMPSGHWHITIGNPMRPVFTSGDLILESSGVTVELGPHLAFNDLPSTIKATFTLSPARNLGLQEIMERFNSGYLRSVEYKPSVKEDGYSDSLKNQGVTIPPKTTVTPVTGPNFGPTQSVSNSVSSSESREVPVNASNSFNTGGQSQAASDIDASLAIRGNPNIA